MKRYQKQSKALEHLQKNDPILYELAREIKLEERQISKDLFYDLIDSIISQQLSVKASATILNRVKKLFPKEQITPENVLKIPDEKIRACGVSYSKIRYMKNVANAVVNGEIHLDKFIEMDASDIEKELIKIKGIGPWTVEMFLMFSLGHEDVFSLGDQGLKNAIAKIYNLKALPTREQMLEISSKWSPYRTFACRILWKSLDNSPKLTLK